MSQAFFYQTKSGFYYEIQENEQISVVMTGSFASLTEAQNHAADYHSPDSAMVFNQKETASIAKKRTDFKAAIAEATTVG